MPGSSGSTFTSNPGFGVAHTTEVPLVEKEMAADPPTKWNVLTWVGTAVLGTTVFCVVTDELGVVAVVVEVLVVREVAVVDEDDDVVGEVDDEADEEEVDDVDDVVEVPAVAAVVEPAVVSVLDDVVVMLVVE